MQMQVQIKLPMKNETNKVNDINATSIVGRILRRIERFNFNAKDKVDNDYYNAPFSKHL